MPTMFPRLPYLREHLEHGGRPVTEGEEIGAHKSTYSPLSSDSQHELGKRHAMKLA